VAGARIAITTFCAVALAIASVLPASAHIDVAAPEGPQAGTGPVTLAFSAESESSTGIVGVQTQLPPGIAPEDVTLAGGPAG